MKNTQTKTNRIVEKLKQKRQEKTLKNAKGITLMALVITIIVLLILAGITIGMITGDNGIIGKANDAKLETEKSDIEEQINTIVIRNSESYTMDKDKIIGDFEEELPQGKEIVDSDDFIYIIYPEYSFEVDIETGKVTTTEVEKVKDETPWELAGSGTEEDPYLIESIEDLVAFSNSVNEGNEYYDEYVKLVNDLDFNLSFSYDNPKTKVSEKTNRIIKEDSSGTEIKEFMTSGTGFNPIGGQIYRTNCFRGSFDGNGKEIKNIYINRPEENSVGLFGQEAIIVDNLGVSGYIVGNKYVAGIIAGNGEKRATIRNCYNKAEVIGKVAVAGVAAYSTNVENCYNVGKIKMIASDATQTTDLAIGGITANPQTSGYVKSCYNLGDIIAERAYGTGGITGFYGRISNCYNISKVEGISSYIGGISGGGNSTFSIIGCYNKGNIIGKKASGISGDASVNVSNCYYLKGTATGGINGEDIEGQAMPLPEAEMPSAISVLMTDNEKVEWNGQMVDVWKEDTNNINNGYPILYWQ